MTKHVSQAEKRFGDAAKDLPNGGDLLGMQIGLRLANNAASGLPVLLRKESTSQQIATIALSETILKASSAETQKKGEGLHLGDLKALNQGQLDQLNSPIFVDADHIFSLLTVFYKVLTSGSGDKPNWGDITQDKSVWAYVKKGLEELGKTEYGSSALGAQGKSIVNNTVKLVDEIKNYSANQTAGRVTDIVNEVKGLREQAEKLVAAASLKRCKTAYPMPQQDQINFPDLVNNSIATLAAQTWGHQLATILEQLDGSRALYKVTRDDKLATLDQSKRFRATLKPLSEGSPNWDSLQRMLVGLIHAIAQMTLELQHLRAISAIMVASIDVISAACDAYSRRSGTTSDVKLGGITPQDYGFKTIIAHLGNFTSVANVLERAVQTYSDLFDRQFTRGFMLLQKADLGVEVPGDRVERSCRELLEWASSTELDLKNVIERMQTEIEKEIDQRLVELRDNFRFVGGDLTSASIKKAREEHIVELTAALQSAPRQI
ncbi:hypothetical protein FRB90_005687 [Tulasnella sp. 427]|nr:hypothetical protein FRB90_005687 [Tulasnella sp. 427]